MKRDVRKWWWLCQYTVYVVLLVVLHKWIVVRMSNLTPAKIGSKIVTSHHQFPDQGRMTLNGQCYGKRERDFVLE